MTAAKNVTANFNNLLLPNQYALTVSLTGTGSGTVTGSGINCFEGNGTDCVETFTNGTQVTLTATPNSWSSFTGWSGDCTGTGSCAFMMNAAKTVMATFNTGTTQYKIYLPLTVK